MLQALDLLRYSPHCRRHHWRAAGEGLKDSVRKGIGVCGVHVDISRLVITGHGIRGVLMGDEADFRLTDSLRRSVFA